MIIPYALLQATICPMVVAALIPLLGKRLGKRLGWVAFGILAYSTFLLLNVGWAIWNGQGPIYEEYFWNTAIFSLKFGFLADGLSLPVALIMNVICAVCAVYSIQYIDHRIVQLYGNMGRGMYPVYFSLYLLFAVGLVGVALSTNLIELYLFIELALIPSYFMIDLFGYVDRHRIAIMYFIWNHVGAALFLLGVISAYMGTGSFDVSALSSISGTALGFWVCFLILVGWLVKMATIGFHVWLPWAHGEHPTSIAAIIATIVGLGSYIIARLLLGELFNNFIVFSVPLMVLAVITIVYGALLTIAQNDIKRLYACSTISQTAYSLLGLASCTTFGAVGGIFYFLSHCMGKAILFSVAGIIVYQTGVRDMRQMGGLARKMPLTATLCILGSMILSAIPPLSGFPAEWIMFVGIFQQGTYSTFNLVVALVGIFATFLTIVYTFWPVMRIFFGPIPPSMIEVKKEAPMSMIVPLLVLAAISLIIGIFPGLITQFLISVLGSIP